MLGSPLTPVNLSQPSEAPPPEALPPDFDDIADISAILNSPILPRKGAAPTSVLGGSIFSPPRFVPTPSLAADASTMSEAAKDARLRMFRASHAESRSDAATTSPPRERARSRSKSPLMAALLAQQALAPPADGSPESRAVYDGAHQGPGSLPTAPSASAAAPAEDAESSLEHIEAVLARARASSASGRFSGSKRTADGLEPLLADTSTTAQMVDVIDATIGHHHGAAALVASSSLLPPMADDEAQAMLDDAEDMDVTALKLLLRRALRDRDAYRRQFEQAAEALHGAQQETRRMRDAMLATQTAFAAQQRQRLPRLVVEWLQRHVAAARLRAFRTWHAALQRDAQQAAALRHRDQVLRLARAALLKLRQRAQLRALQRWRGTVATQRRIADAAALSLRAAHRRRRLAALWRRWRLRWRQRAQLRRVLQRHVLRRRGLLRVALQRWRRAAHRVESQLQRRDTLRSRLATLLLRRAARFGDVSRAFALWRADTARRRQRVAHLASVLRDALLRRTAWRPLRVAFLRWRRVSLVAAPRAERCAARLARLLRVSRGQRLRVAWARWSRAARGDSARAAALRRLVARYAAREPLRVAWRRWSLATQRALATASRDTRSDVARRLRRLRHLWLVLLLKQRLRAALWQWRFAVRQLRHRDAWRAEAAQLRDALRLTRQSLTLHAHDTTATQRELAQRGAAQATALRALWLRYLLQRHALTRRAARLAAAWASWRDTTRATRHAAALTALHVACVREYRGFLAAHVAATHRRRELARRWQRWRRVARVARGLARLPPLLARHALRRRWQRWRRLAPLVTRRLAALRALLRRARDRDASLALRRWREAARRRAALQRALARLCRGWRVAQQRGAFGAWAAGRLVSRCAALRVAEAAAQAATQARRACLAATLQRWARHVAVARAQRRALRSVVARVFVPRRLRHVRDTFWRRWATRCVEAPRRVARALQLLRLAATRRAAQRVAAALATWKTAALQATRAQLAAVAATALATQSRVAEVSRQFAALRDEEARHVRVYHALARRLDATVERFGAFVARWGHRRDALRRCWVAWRLWRHRERVARFYTAQRQTRRLARCFVHWRLAQATRGADRYLATRLRARHERALLATLWHHWTRRLAQLRLALQVTSPPPALCVSLRLSVSRRVSPVSRCVAACVCSVWRTD